MRMTWRGRFGGAIVAGAAATAACTLLTPLDGLSDDTSSVTDAASADGASEDATASDGAVGDATIPFCATTDARFCDDFERDTLQGEWTSVDARPDASVRIVSDGGNRYFAAVEPYADAGPSSARFYKNYQSSSVSARATLTFKMYVHDYTKASSSPLATIFVGNNTTWADVGLRMDTTHVFALQENKNGSYGTFPLDEPIIPGRWYTVRMWLDLSVSPVRLHVDVDGKTSVDAATNVGFFAAPVSFQVGPAYLASESPGVAVDYDDVSADFF